MLTVQTSWSLCFLWLTVRWVASPKDQETIPDLGEAFPLGVVVIVLGWLLCIFLERSIGVETVQDSALL
jgi:hypothetical protein